ncbi:MAG: lytic transglycosylase domain-containing protein [Pseudomonadota bacterium]
MRDVGHGLLEVSHNTLALLGLVLASLVVFGATRADVRHEVEAHALDWLQARQEARAEPVDPLAAELSEPDAIARATASDPKGLNRQQASVALWLSRKYRVAPEPVSRLVQEAWSVGQKAGLDPTLILAIMAVESSFNPFAQSSVGAQGLMQVMTKVHNDKYEAFGGNHAAFDPVTNLRVGVQVLKECISRAGGLEAGLRFYVGAANLPDDGGYASKVLNEQRALRLVASGKSVPTMAPRQILTSAPATPKTDAAPKPEAVAPPTPEQIAMLR